MVYRAHRSCPSATYTMCKRTLRSLRMRPPVLVQGRLSPGTPLTHAVRNQSDAFVSCSRASKQKGAVVDHSEVYGSRRLCEM